MKKIRGHRRILSILLDNPELYILEPVTYGITSFSVRIKPGNASIKRGIFTKLLPYLDRVAIPKFISKNLQGLNPLFWRCYKLKKEILKLQHMSIDEIINANNEGPSPERIPASQYLSCMGCKHLKSRLVKSGLNPEYRNDCLHPNCPEPTPMKLSFTGNLSDDLVTPNWCPVLYPNKNIHDTLENITIHHRKRMVTEKLAIAENFNTTEIVDAGKKYLVGENIELWSDTHNFYYKIISKVEFEDYNKCKLIRL